MFLVFVEAVKIFEVIMRTFLVGVIDDYYDLLEIGENYVDAGYIYLN